MLRIDPTSYGCPIVMGSETEITVGKYCSIANSAVFDCGIQHNTGWLTTYPLWNVGGPEKREGMSKGPIVVGSDVWIGHEAMIMSGVTIGDGAVIAARAVVTRDVRPYAVVGGVPARFLKWRFHETVVTMLQKIKWWDWPEEKVREHADLLMSDNWQKLFEVAGFARVNNDFVMPRAEDYELGN